MPILNIMKRLIFLLAVIAVSITLSNAQTNELPSIVGKGRIMTTDGHKIVFTNLTTGIDNHSYKTSDDSKSQTIPAENVMSIEQQTGTEAGKWGLWLGVSGLVGSLLGVLSAKTDADLYGVETDDTKIVPIVAGITAASALIGVAIGSGKKKYKTIYTNPKYVNSSILGSVRIGVSCSRKQGIGLGFQCRF